jgi:Protein of unknown function (DUF2612)
MSLVAEGIARVLNQYKNSPKLLATIEALLTPLAEVQDVLSNMLSLADVDTQNGVQLDVIGRLVGIGRTVPNAAVSGLTLVPVLVDDASYRILIKAKAFKNTSKGYPEDINTALSMLWPDVGTIFVNTGDMEITVLFQATVTPYMLALLREIDILPRAAGVGLNVAEITEDGSFFGFDDCPLSDTFGEDDDPTMGSPFAEFL